MKLVQGAGRSCLADPAGPEYAAAAGHVPGRCLVGGEQLELAGMGVPAGHPAGPCSGAQNFWYFAKEHLDRTKKEKPKRVGFNSHQ